MISLTEGGELKGYERLKAYPEVAHFVTTRQGGFSGGTYASFNCSPFTHDSCRHVISNQQRLFELMNDKIGELIIPRQVHDCLVLPIDKSFFKLSQASRQATLEGIDALMTDVPGCCVAVTTADCVPVLVYDKKQQAVAAIHAGWKGTVKHIVTNAIRCMKSRYGTQGEDIVACIGPSISLESFEVGDEVYEAFKESGFDMSLISVKNSHSGKYHIDLWEANRQELLDMGVPKQQIEVAGVCTYIHQDEFFSARRLGIDSGRILSGLMIRK